MQGISADQPWYALCLRLINAEMRHHQLAFGKTSRQDALSAVMEDIRNSMKSFLDEKEISSIAQQDLDEIRGILNFADKRTSVVLAVSKFCQPERPFKPSMYTDIIQELLVFEPGDALIDSEIAALSHLLCFQEALDTFQLTKASVAMFQSGKYLKNLSVRASWTDGRCLLIPFRLDPTFMRGYGNSLMPCFSIMRSCFTGSSRRRKPLFHCPQDRNEKE